ncbi:TPA: VOC family protein [Staphylococcus aureus]|nr:VOC family protein [Staphylococcus aureus]
MYRVGHLQYKVKSIENAIKKFEELGFKIERANKKSKNAFIWFESGPYIELIEMNGKLILFAYLFRWMYGIAMKKRWEKWCCNKDGFIDFAIEPINYKQRDMKNFSENKKILENYDIKSNKVITWSRKNLKNDKILFSYLPVIPVTLPFIVSDYSVNQRPTKVSHNNNIIKIKRLSFICEKKEYALLNSIISQDDHIQLNFGKVTEIDQVILENKKGELFRLTNHMTLERE